MKKTISLILAAIIIAIPTFALAGNIKEIEVLYLTRNYKKLEKETGKEEVKLTVERVSEWKHEGKHNVVNPNIFFDEDVNLNYKKGDTLEFGLGIKVKIPKGYRLIITPNKYIEQNFKLEQIEHMQLIGNTDEELKVRFRAIGNGSIKRFDSLCKMELVEDTDIKIKHMLPSPSDLYE